jgi:predicted RNA-binding Zn ribbon-like protein
MMDLSQTNPDRFDHNSGDLSLSFTNTNDWHASDHPEEILHTYNGLVLWAKSLQVVSSEEADQLWHLAGQRPLEAEEVYRRATQLRESLYRIFTAIIRGETFSERDFGTLNQEISSSYSNIRIRNKTEGFEWTWDQNPEALDKVIWPIVKAAVELLTSDQLDRLGQCADDRGCGWLFLDTSRNRSRQWCSMESCGNRAKAKRYYNRTR